MPARDQAVRAHAIDAAARAQLDVGIFQHLDAFAHAQAVLDVVIGDDQGHGVPVRFCGPEATTARPDRSESGFPKDSEGAILTH